MNMKHILIVLCFNFLHGYGQDSVYRDFTNLSPTNEGQYFDLGAFAGGVNGEQLSNLNAFGGIMNPSLTSLNIPSSEFNSALNTVHIPETNSFSQPNYFDSALSNIADNFIAFGTPNSPPHQSRAIFQLNDKSFGPEDFNTDIWNIKNFIGHRTPAKQSYAFNTGASDNLANQMFSNYYNPLYENAYNEESQYLRFGNENEMDFSNTRFDSFNETPQFGSYLDFNQNVENTFGNYIFPTQGFPNSNVLSPYLQNYDTVEEVNPTYYSYFLNQGSSYDTSMGSSSQSFDMFQQGNSVVTSNNFPFEINDNDTSFNFSFPTETGTPDGFVSRSSNSSSLTGIGTTSELNFEFFQTTLNPSNFEENVTTVDVKSEEQLIEECIVRMSSLKVLNTEECLSKLRGNNESRGNSNSDKKRFMCLKQLLGKKRPKTPLMKKAFIAADFTPEDKQVVETCTKQILKLQRRKRRYPMISWRRAFSLYEKIMECLSDSCEKQSRRRAK
ncbi:uncharacterized protein LOC143229173 [Tachypleus tridentatus]|uniref:uncharacterized protein LOC143229173 n=1 Tax=Tachypleus tridentatus TaxID=6853 RepID=UPI003FD6895F